MNIPKENPIVLFDGVCTFCNGTVNFIINYDKKNTFYFSPLQSETAAKLLSDTGQSFHQNLDTIVLIHGKKKFIKSDAILEITRLLGGGFVLLYPLKIVPRFIRDWCYETFAAYRYKLFGKKESCMIPTAEVRKKFLL